MKTSELTGAALDWAVAKCEVPNNNLGHFLKLRAEHVLHRRFFYSTDWAQGGPIIEREKITLLWQPPSTEHYCGNRWFATTGDVREEDTLGEHHETSPLIAAMRCYVASKLGEEVEIPKELS
jgi:hypothetical protein